MLGATPPAQRPPHVDSLSEEDRRSLPEPPCLVGGELQADSRPLPSGLCPGSQRPQVLKPSSTFTPIKPGAGSVTVTK